MPALPIDRLADDKPSLLLRESDPGGADAPNLLSKLSGHELARVWDISKPRQFRAGEDIFLQGQLHDGIFVILSGQVRTYYTGPSGREITLAFWSPGNFVGGPEIFGGGLHVWSGRAMRRTQVMHIKGAGLRRLMAEIPNLAVALVEALEHKGKCYSAMIHMLGTRSAAERLAQLLLLIAERDGRPGRGGVVIRRRLTHDDLAKMVGATRQWVTATLDRLTDQGMIAISPTEIVVTDEQRLRRFAGYADEAAPPNLSVAGA
jgi:CRP/FNR family transcriptional regulator, cyclic AMP receptor protein